MAAYRERPEVVSRCIERFQISRLRFVDDLHDKEIAACRIPTRDGVAGQLKRIRKALRTAFWNPKEARLEPTSSPGDTTRLAASSIQHDRPSVNRRNTEHFVLHACGRCSAEQSRPPTQGPGSLRLHLYDPSMYRRPSRPQGQHRAERAAARPSAEPSKEPLIMNIDCVPRLLVVSRMSEIEGSHLSPVVRIRVSREAAAVRTIPRRDDEVLSLNTPRRKP